jgi:hypothetical protein
MRRSVSFQSAREHELAGVCAFFSQKWLYVRSLHVRWRADPSKLVGWTEAKNDDGWDRGENGRG